MNKRIMFWARECPHCKAMMPYVDKLEKETGIKLEKLEIWHNEKNADLMRSYRPIIAPKCGGQLRTPTFFRQRELSSQFWLQDRGYPCPLSQHNLFLQEAPCQLFLSFL